MSSEKNKDRRITDEVRDVMRLRRYPIPMPLSFREGCQFVCRRKRYRTFLNLTALRRALFADRLFQMSYLFGKLFCKCLILN